MPRTGPAGSGNGWPILATGSTGRRAVSTGCSSRRPNSAEKLIFHRRAALDKLGERLLDANPPERPAEQDHRHHRRKITKQHCRKLQTEIEDMHLPNPVIRSHYRNGFIKQYVRDHLILRTEAATNNVTD